MEEEKSVFKNQAKMTFFLGLFIGIAAISTFALFFTLAVTANKDKADNTNSQAAAENGDVAGEETFDVEAEQESAQQAAVNVEKVVNLDNAPVRGNPDAAVTIIEFSDFECPYSRRHKPTMDQIYEEYGDQVAIYFKHFPLSFHSNAQKAAEASECANEQGKFWEMYDKIFAAAEAGDMSVDKWKEAAADLGLNTGQFNSCLDDGKYANKVDADLQEGIAAGVEGTPGTYVNGTLISGAYPFDSFQSIIDTELGQ